MLRKYLAKPMLGLQSEKDGLFGKGCLIVLPQEN
jgi:hypothetical protein